MKILQFKNTKPEMENSVDGLGSTRSGEKNQ